MTARQVTIVPLAEDCQRSQERVKMSKPHAKLSSTAAQLSTMGGNHHTPYACNTPTPHSQPLH